MGRWLGSKGDYCVVHNCQSGESAALNWFDSQQSSAYYSDERVFRLGGFNSDTAGPGSVINRMQWMFRRPPHSLL